MHQPHRGFSLIECSIAVAALAVALSIALPSLTALHRTHQVRAAMLELAAHLALARSTSITRGDPVGMCPRESSDACAAGGSPPFSRTLTRRPIKAMRSVHVKAQEVHCRVQAWRG
ncbi:GspH/FimT family pseudopilin [Xanthomonas phaseoli]|nr:GspH/FimT family pseudopilin [Xanthomonas phaseoli]